jgi:hypothetical protein
MKTGSELNSDARQEKPDVFLPVNIIPSMTCLIFDHIDRPCQILLGYVTALAGWPSNKNTF